MLGVGSGELALLAVIALVVIAGALGALLAVVFVVVMIRRRSAAPDPGAVRDEALVGLGYAKAGPRSWTRSIQGTSMTFEELPSGDLKWTVRLPRYNTMTLDLAERASGRTVDGEFTTGIPELDERFVLGSPLAARIVALLGQPKLQRALLAMPNLAMHLGADELVLEDPGGAGLVAIGASADAHLEHHALVANVVNTLFSVLYTASGTVFDEYR